MWIGYEIVLFESGLMLSKGCFRKFEYIFKENVFIILFRYLYNYIKMIFFCCWCLVEEYGLWVCCEL